jgi:predicted permease
MSLVHYLIRRFRYLLRRKKIEAEMAEEMRFHLEQRTEDNTADGVAPEDAKYAAQRKFGNVVSIQEQARDQRGWVRLEQTFQDLRYAVRQLRRNPGFAVFAVLSLGLGIGANTAIFSVVNEVLLKSLPVRKPQELVLFQWAIAGGFEVRVSGDWENDPNTKLTTCTSFSLQAFERFREGNGTLSALFAFTPLWQPTLMVDGQAESSSGGQLVSGDYFTGLGVSAVRGHLIAPDDDRAGAPPVAVISYGYWMRRFGGAPDVLGKTISVNGAPATIIGITPREFIGALDVGVAPDLSVPLAMLPAVDQWLGSDARKVGAPWLLRIMGRRVPGKSAEQIQDNFEGIFQKLALEDQAAEGSSDARAGRGATVEPPRLLVIPGGKGLNSLRHNYKPRLMLLMGLVGLVLLIACANVANLLLARGLARRREIAARLAIGASRGRIIRQLLTECGVLVLLGGTLGVIVAYWGRGLATLPFTSEDGQVLVLPSAIDWRVLIFTATVAIFTGAIFGLVPALRATQIDLSAEFQGGGRSLGLGSRQWLGKTLLAAQVALSLVLLVGAGLFVRTLGKLDSVELGFNSERLLLFKITAIAGGGPDERAAVVHARILERVAALPGVQGATFSWMPLLTGAGANTTITIPGRTPVPEGNDSALVNAVGPEFFSTLEIPILLGRGFNRRDDGPAARVAVVNDQLVRQYFEGQNPIGRHLIYHARPGPLTDVEIVGVVRDSKYTEVKGEMPATLFVPFDQDSWSIANYAVRGISNPEALVPSIRAAVRAIDPKLPLADVRTQNAQIAKLSASERMFARFAGFFGALALVLVCVGLYGLLSYGVARRTSEIGVRIALGAEPMDIRWMVLRESLVVIGVGVLIGLASATVLARLVAGMIYGIAAVDPLTYGAVALLMLGVALLACWLPARHAARVDPIIALRAE